MARFTFQFFVVAPLLVAAQAATLGPGVLDHEYEGTVSRHAKFSTGTQYNPHCYHPFEATPGTVSGAVECAQLLQRMGKRECRAKESGTVMCKAGGTVIKGFAVGKSSVSSYFRDVVHAVVWVLDNCPTCGGRKRDVAGIEAAKGNGDLAIKISGR